MGSGPTEWHPPHHTASSFPSCGAASYVVSASLLPLSTWILPLQIIKATTQMASLNWQLEKTDKRVNKSQRWNSCSHLLVRVEAHFQDRDEVASHSKYPCCISLGPDCGSLTPTGKHLLGGAVPTEVNYNYSTGARIG